MGRTGEYYGGLQPVAERLNGTLALAGMILILASLIVFKPDWGAPGYRVVPLVAGTVLVLLFTTRGTLVYRVLSLRVMIWAGVVSYSAYLWHQPLFAFVRIASFDPPSQAVMMTLILLTFVLAWISWALVEQPFRHRLPHRLVYGGVIVGFAGIFGIGVLAHVQNGMTALRFADQRAVWFDTVSFSPLRKECHAPPSRLPPADKACAYFGDAAPTWAVLGDSHGVELSYALGRALEARGKALVQLTGSACPPAYTFGSKIRDCSDWTRASVDWLVSQPDIDTVVLAYRHVVHLYPQIEPVLQGTPSIFEGTTDAEKRAIYWDGLSGMTRRLSDAGKRVILLEPVPDIHKHINKYIRLKPMQDRRLPTVPRAEHDRVSAEVLVRFDTLPADRMAADVLCDDAQCYGADSGGSFYFDNNHLSVLGATRIVTSFFDAEDQP